MTGLIATIKDLFSPLRNNEFWVFMGGNDIKYKYRRTLLGPFWLMLTNTAYIAMLAFIFGALFKNDDPTYVSYVASGVVFWNFIGQVLRESSVVYVDKKGFLMQTGTFRPAQLVYWIIWRNVIILAHQIPIIILTLLIFHVMPNPVIALWFIPGFLMLLMILLPVGLTLGLMTARLRDLEPLITMALTMLFFVTPIMWHPEQLGDLESIVWWNPATYLLDLVRQPLLGHPIDPMIYVVSAGMAVCAWVVAIFLYWRFSRRIVFWV